MTSRVLQTKPLTNVDQYFFLRNTLCSNRDVFLYLLPVVASIRDSRLPAFCRPDEPCREHTRVGTLIVATIYLQLIQNRYMFRSFTVLQCSHQHCVQPVASDVEVVGYL